MRYDASILKIFFQQMEEYRDRVGEKCNCGPVLTGRMYHNLKENELESYFRWRKDLIDDEAVPTKDGFVWLRLCELLNLDFPPEEVIREIRSLNGRYFYSSEMVSKFAVDYCIDHGLPLDGIDIPVKCPEPYMSILISEKLSGTPGSFGRSTVRAIVGREQETCDEKTVLEVINTAFPMIDAYFREKRGKGLAEVFGSPVITSHFPYKEFATREEHDRKVLRHLSFDIQGEFGEFVNGLYSCAANEVGRLYADRGCRVPTSFSKDLRAIVKKAMELVDEEKNVVAESSPLSTFDFKRDLSSIVDEPLCIVSFDESDKRDYVRLSTDISLNKRNKGFGPADYVPSGMKNVTYSQMSREQNKYYLHWRQSLLDGHPILTDSGYMWLFIVETINDDTPMESRIERLRKLSVTYESNRTSKQWLYHQAGSSYVDLCCSEGYEDVDSYAHDSSLICPFFMDSLLKNRSSYATPERFRAFISSSGTVLSSRFGDETMAAAFDVFLGLQRKMAEKRLSIVKHCDVKMTSTRAALFTMVRRYNPMVTKTVWKLTYCDYHGCLEFMKTLRDLLEEIERRTAEIGTGKVKARKVRFFGIEVGTGLPDDPLDSVMECISSRIERKTIADRMSAITIDSDDVDRAQKDLDAVSEMLFTGDDEEPAGVPEKAEIEAPIEGTPMEMFLLSLEPVQRRYLDALVSGTDIGAILREAKVTETIMEDSVNSVAVDILGETIVEGGSLFEEYVDELRSAMVPFTNQ